MTIGVERDPSDRSQNHPDAAGAAPENPKARTHRKRRHDAIQHPQLDVRTQGRYDPSRESR